MPRELRAIILGSAAGGGIPQWNCACEICELARSGDTRVQPRTQASIAVSTDGEHWLILCASPDLRQQIVRTPALAPRKLRDSPIFGVVLLSAEVDGMAGLLALRERQSLQLFAPDMIQSVLVQNPMFSVLDPELVVRVPVNGTLDAGFGLRLRLVPLPGKVPLYSEASGVDHAADGYAALIEAAGRRMLIAPACADITPAVRDLVGGSDVVLFDGTLFHDDEMIAAGVGVKTGRRMGHAPISGPDGSLALLSGLGNRVIYVHINNTNRVLIEDSPERRAVENAGFQVAYDGMEIRCG